MKKTTILAIDDDPTILAAINNILGAEYRMRGITSSHRALDVASTFPIPDLILLDVIMPDEDGFQILKKLKNNPITEEIPVIFVTSMEADIDEEKGISYGAVDYITKPIKPAILKARVKSHLISKQAKDFLNNKNTFLESEVLKRMKENLIIQDVSIRALAHLAETRDPETGNHILRTQSYVHTIASLLQQDSRLKEPINNHFIELLTKSAPLHDIGKVGIPDNILLKPGKLNKEEWEIMKSHAFLGACALEKAEKDVEQPVEFLSLAKEIAHWHHEKWDGSGYPDGLNNNAIPLSSRIMAIADVFDALISKRVYKEPMSYQQTKEIISSEKGKHFDPLITELFIINYQKFVKIADEYQDNN